MALIEQVKNDSSLASDKSLRSFLWSLEQLVKSLDDSSQSPIFEKAARLFQQDIDLAGVASRLRELLMTWVTSFQAHRLERLRTAPIDETRMAEVRRAMSEAVLTPGPHLTCFLDYNIRREEDESLPSHEFTFGSFSRGLFTKPEMSLASFEEVPGFFAKNMRDVVSQWILRELYGQPKHSVPVDVSTERGSFWRLAQAEASKVGREPMLLVPFEIGRDIADAAFSGGGPAGLTVTRDPSISQGNTARYLGSLDGIPVFSSPYLGRHAILCSRRHLQSITFGVLHGGRDIANFDFIPGDDLENCRFLIKFSCRMDWADGAFVEFALNSDDVATELPTS